MIYVFKTISYPAFIKVGYSKNSPDKRIKSVQTGCPHKIEILFVKEGRPALESMIHGHLKEFKTHGEWFIFSPECEEKLMAFFGVYKPQNVEVENLTSRRSRQWANPERTKKIIELLKQGHTTYKTAEILGINRHTVMRHANTYSKRVEVVRKLETPTPK